MIPRCPKCNCVLDKSVLDDYVFYCKDCDEDFYRFEVKE